MALALPGTYQAHVFHHHLVCQLLLLQLHFQGAHIFTQLHLLGPVILLGPLHGQGALCLQLSEVFLVFIQQVLHLLLVNLKTNHRPGEGLQQETPGVGILADTLLACILPSFSSSYPFSLLPRAAQGSPRAWGTHNTFSLLSSHLDLHLMPLLCLLHLPVLVPQLCSLLLQLPAGDLPEGVNLVTLQLEIVALFPFPVQLLSEMRNMLLQLQSQGEETSRQKRRPRTDASARHSWQAVLQTWQDTMAVTGKEKLRREGEEP